MNEIFMTPAAHMVFGGFAVLGLIGCAVAAGTKLRGTPIAAILGTGGFALMLLAEALFLLMGVAQDHSPDAVSCLIVAARFARIAGLVAVFAGLLAFRHRTGSPSPVEPPTAFAYEKTLQAAPVQTLQG